MSEINVTRRLSKVAKELNVGIQTIVAFLGEKGIGIENNPNSKITDQAYEALLLKFQPDKLDKEKSSKLNLTPLIHKEDADHKAHHHAEAAHPIAVAPAPTPAPAPVVAEAPPLVEEIAPPVKTKEKTKPAAEAAAIVTDVKPEEESAKFKVVGKIDLDNLSSGSKGKGRKAKEEVAEVKKPSKGKEEDVKEEKPAEEEIKPKPKGKKVIQPEPEILAEIPKQIPEPKDQPEEKPADEDKKGLTIVGKIDLTQFQPKKKTPIASTDDSAAGKKKRRKRKRIPLDTAKAAEEDKLRREAYRKANPLGGSFPPLQGGARPRPVAPGQPMDSKEKAALDEKRIQEEIKKTISKLTQRNTPTGEAKSRLKKRKKEERRQRKEDEDVSTDSHVIQVTEFITANDLASLMNVSVTDVITACLNLGLMVSINQRLDAETITVVADEFQYDVIFKEAEMDEPALEEPDNEEAVIQRAPIVTIMGHVDHGKTSLLDYIRSSNVVAGEAGGITQHIGAYEVTLESGKRITFLDTPGHEAFTAMRARGAKVTDIVIIVIAADDSVMPQTKEAVSHALAAGVPIVFAFNKIDKEGANTQRIREQLSELNILVEEWGGKYQTQEISAKKGLNVDKLLEKVIFEADLLDLKADPTKRAIGTVIEASLDKGKGIVATLLVQKGTLRVGDPILAGANYGKVKAMFNERGVKMAEAGPSAPVQILGFDGAPTSGDKFYVTESEQQAKEIAGKRKQLIREQGIRTRKHITLDEIGRRLAIGNFKELNLVIKGDVDGSVEALSDSLLRLSTEEIQVNTIYKGVGQITESDVLLASASDAIIIGFQVRPSPTARKLAEQEQIDIRLYSIIYNAIEELKAAMEGMLAPTKEEKIVGNIEIREVFKISKVGTVAGCYVLDGRVTRNTKIRVVRDGVVVYTGELSSLKRFKDDVKEVSAGYECGLTIERFNDIKQGDIIEGYEEFEVKRTL